MIHLDTSVLIDALTGPKRSAARRRGAIEQGERLVRASIALYEWRHGPRSPREPAAQEALLRETAAPFGAAEAALAAALYRTVRHLRGREIDLAVAACALVHGATLWTHNVGGFRDIPDLRLY